MGPWPVQGARVQCAGTLGLRANGPQAAKRGRCCEFREGSDDNWVSFALPPTTPAPSPTVLGLLCPTYGETEAWGPSQWGWGSGPERAHSGVWDL